MRGCVACCGRTGTALGCTVHMCLHVRRGFAENVCGMSLHAAIVWQAHIQKGLIASGLDKCSVGSVLVLQGCALYGCIMMLHSVFTPGVQHMMCAQHVCI